MLITPSLTPVYFNNPSFTILDVTKRPNSDHLVFQSLFVRAFQLQYNILFNSDIWTSLDPKRVYGQDLNDPATLNPFTFIPTSWHFGYFLAFEYGYDRFARQAIGIIVNVARMVVLKGMTDKVLCSMQYY